jgi:hypothetical protein
LLSVTVGVKKPANNPLNVPVPVYGIVGVAVPPVQETVTMPSEPAKHDTCCTIEVVHKKGDG